MTLTPQLIAPFQTGLEFDVEPWLAPADSFRTATNVHVRHGYVEKRGGYRIFGQLQTLEDTSTITGITQANPGEVTTAAPHGYITGDLIFISGVGGMTEVNNTYFTIIVTSPTTFTLGIDTSTFGAYTLGGIAQVLSPSTDRVMGIARRITASGGRTTLAFDTTRAYRYSTISDQFLALDASPIFNGGDEDYIWATNWQSRGVVNRLYFTNGLPYDGTFNGIRFYDASGTTNTTTLFNPAIDSAGTSFLLGATLIFVLRQRIIALNTFEGAVGSATNFPQRARWCQAQTPSNWVDDSPGNQGGGFVDAPTGDQIISARALQNQIIVFFTDSVWSLTPLSNPSLPFVWQKINNFRACGGKMASVGYDRYVAALGNRGITATDGIETKRIDQKIEDFADEMINIQSFGKVFCERSYSETRWWTLYPMISDDGNDSSTLNTENTAALIYDDDSGAFTTYEIHLNTLGYGNFSRDFALSDFTAANNLDFTLDDFNEETLQSFYFLDSSETFLGGDINGIVYVLETMNTDNGSSINIDLRTNSWNPFRSQGIEAQMSYVDLYIDTDPDARVNVEFFKNDTKAPYVQQQLNFLPNLNFLGDVINITQANPANVNMANHGLDTGTEIFIYGVIGMTEINDGPYTITVIDSNHFTLDGVDSTTFTAYSTGGKVFSQAFYKERVWKRVFAGGIGYEHSMRIFSENNDYPIRIHALKPYFKPRGRRTVT